MMEIAFPSLRSLQGLGCITKTAPSENSIDATGMPFRAPSLLSESVSKTCTELVLNTCELDELPPLIGMFFLLRKLDVSDNKLEEIPPDIGSCYSLRVLNISSNQIKAIPEELSQLIHLEKFLAYSNRIVVVPEWLGSLQLDELNLFNNKVLKLPETLGNLELVSEMNLAANVIMQIPPESISKWINVRVLNLYDCRLIKLPETFGHLLQLEELRLFNNNLEQVPVFGGSLKKLKVIELNKNRITELPLSFFVGLSALERIVLNNNQIEAIPVGINCPKLESFLASSNCIKELPPDMPLWPSLRVLFVNANQLTKLPETFMQNTWIERVNLSRNSKCVVPARHILMHLKSVCEKNKGKYWAPDTL